jgi:hypothetical protein
MQKRYVLFFLIACSSMSCGNNQSKEQKPVGKIAAAPPVYKMDMLEKIFDNDNWMKTTGKDTSYYYFSRIPSEIKVCKYKIIKGDSVISNLSVMKFSNDSLVWEFDDTTHLYLNSVTEKSAEWVTIEEPPGAFMMGFEKKDEKHMNIVKADRKQAVMTKTIPLSTFLVRSRYDYLNGTHYAFSDTVFSTGKKK